MVDPQDPYPAGLARARAALTASSDVADASQADELPVDVDAGAPAQVDDSSRWNTEEIAARMAWAAERDALHKRLDEVTAERDRARADLARALATLSRIGVEVATAMAPADPTDT